MTSPTAHHHDLQAGAHSHVFADPGQSQRESALAAVTLLTLATMVLELAVGDRVRFTAERIDGQYTLTTLTKAP